MKIVFYGKALCKPYVTGVERVGYELIVALAARDDVEVVIVAPATVRHKLPDDVKTVVIPLLNDISFFFLFGFFARLFRADWILTPNSLPCLLSLGVPQAVCVHDTAWSFFRRSFTPLQRRYLVAAHWLTARLATLVYCPSQASADDYVRLFKYRRKLVVTPWGSDHFEPHDAGVATRFLRECHGIDPEQQPVVVTIGTLQPRKGYGTVIAALRAAPYPVLYVIFGKRGWMSEAIEAEIAAFNRDRPGGSRILWVGDAADALISSMLAVARLFVLASEYEGFGLPVVEAMRCGCAVAIADNSSLKELVIAGQWSFPTGDSERLLAIIETATSDEAELGRQRDLGRQAAARFTWDKAARLLLSQMESA